MIISKTSVFPITAQVLFTMAIIPGLDLQGQGTVEMRIASVDKTLEHFYRGERLEFALGRVGREIDIYNAYAKQRQVEIEKKRVQLDHVNIQVKEDRSRLDILYKELKELVSRNSPDAVKRNIDLQNALVQKLNAQIAKNRREVDDYNDSVRRILSEVEKERLRVFAVQEKVNARVAAFEIFTKTSQDANFFVELNQLLADIRNAQRTTPTDSSLQVALNKVRGFRRELASWAIAGHALRSNGLVIVEALVEDEPCWFVVDTGAMDTILSKGIVDAIGCGQKIGEQTRLSLIGGLRITGHAFRIPRLEVSGQVIEDVAASAVLPSDVGIDGLLGQSFLKSFVYTIDERTPEKLFLTRR